MDVVKPGALRPVVERDDETGWALPKKRRRVVTSLVDVDPDDPKTVSPEFAVEVVQELE